MVRLAAFDYTRFCDFPLLPVLIFQEPPVCLPPVVRMCSTPLVLLPCPLILVLEEEVLEEENGPPHCRFSQLIPVTSSLCCHQVGPLCLTGGCCVCVVWVSRCTHAHTHTLHVSQHVGYFNHSEPRCQDELLESPEEI